jgi:hypothetical protein
MKTKLIFPIMVVVFAAGCGRDGVARADQKNYEVVQEGSASGVTSTLQGPGEVLPPITGTNADTTTAFTIDPNAVGGAPGAPPATVAGTMPTYTPPSSGSQPQMQPRPRPMTSSQPSTGREPEPRTDPRTPPENEPAPAPPPMTDTASAQPQPQQNEPQPPPPAEPQEQEPEEEPEEEVPPPTTTDTRGQLG